jgi:hypothetical protein
MTLTVSAKTSLTKSNGSQIDIFSDPTFGLVVSKTLPIEMYAREIDAYDVIAQFYPVAQRLDHQQQSSTTGRILYEYIDVYSDNSLLNRLLLSDNFQRQDIAPVIAMYRKAFTQTLHSDAGTAASFFFEDRVEPRLLGWYPAGSSALQPQIITVNGRPIVTNARAIIEDACTYFNRSDNQRLCVISQGDPHELNLSSRRIFDYAAGGAVPLMAEFALTFWYEVVQAGRLSAVYDTDSYLFVANDVQLADVVNYSDATGEIRHHPLRSRLYYLDQYVDEVIMPLLPKTYPWQAEFNAHLSMRALCVFKLDSLAEVDQKLVLAYLQCAAQTAQASATPRQFIDRMKQELWHD